jgi:aspartate kinase
LNLKKQYNNGDVISYLYDKGRRLTNKNTVDKNNVIINKYAYGYNKVNMRTFEKKEHLGDIFDNYSYDALNRIKNVTFNADNLTSPSTFTKRRTVKFDKVDNIKELTSKVSNAPITKIEPKMTDDNAGNAEILEINPAQIIEALDEGNIAVVAGFQGVNDRGDIRTLGRGGSDTSAVALAAALEAEKVEIFSDVDGIANCDPKLVSDSKYLESISVNQMLAMADEGSRVIHPRAIKASLKTTTPIVVRNTFSDSPGTLIHHDKSLDKKRVAIAHREGMVLVECEYNHDAKNGVDGVVKIDSRRVLLRDDAYLSGKLSQLEENFGFYKLSRNWATASVVFNSKAPEASELDYAELLDSSENVISYLLKEPRIRETLNFLHSKYTK